MKLKTVVLMSAATLVAGSIVQARQEPAPVQSSAPLTHSPSQSIGMSGGRFVPFAGALRDQAGQPFTSLVSLTFAIYADQEDGAPLWQEIQNVQVNQGNYIALLGSTLGGVPMELVKKDEPRWLGVRINAGQSQEQPRFLLTGVFYAITALNAENFGGRPIADFVLKEPASDSGSKEHDATPTSEKATILPGNADCVAKYGANGTDLVTSNLCEKNGKIGVGLANPSYALHVTGTPGITNLYVGTGNLYVAEGSFDIQAGGDVTTRVQTNGNNHGASFQLNSGNGVTSGRYAYFRFQSLEAQPQEWRLGMYGSKDLGFYNWNKSTSVPALFVRAADNNVGIGTTSPDVPLVVNGNIKSTGQLTSTVATGTPPLAVTSTTQVANLNASLLGGLTPAAARSRGIVYLGGCDTCSPLTDADDQKMIYLNVIGPMTIESVTCYSDDGTPKINIWRDDGSPAPILPGAGLDCAKSGDPTITSFVPGETTLALGEKLDFEIVSAGGVAKRVTVVIKTSVN